MKLNLTQKKINYIFNLVFFKIKKRKKYHFKQVVCLPNLSKKKKKLYDFFK